MRYIAFLYKDSDIGHEDNTAYNAIIPDVDGAYTYGDNFVHAVEMIHEALELVMEEYSDDIPQAHPLEYFTPQKLQALDIPANAIPQVVEYTQPAKKRISININTSSLNSIDNYMKAHGLTNRSAFLEQSALKVVMAS